MLVNCSRRHQNMGGIFSHLVLVVVFVVFTVKVTKCVVLSLLVSCWEASWELFGKAYCNAA